MGKPEVHAWFADDPVADDDPLAPIKRRAAALQSAGEVLEQAARSGTVAARADRIGQAAALFADSAFDPDTVYDACEAGGMPGGAVNAAAHVAVTLREIELGGGALP